MAEQAVCWSCGDPVSDEELVAGECGNCTAELTLDAHVEAIPEVGRLASGEEG